MQPRAKRVASHLALSCTSSGRAVHWVFAATHQHWQPSSVLQSSLLQPYIEPKDTYNFTYIHSLRNSPYITDYNLTWSCTTTCSTNSTWTSTSLAVISWTLSTAWTTSMPPATDWHGDAEGHIHPCLHKPTARLQGVATTDQSLQAQAGVAEQNRRRPC